MKKDKTKVLQRIRERIKPENRVYVEKNLSISQQVYEILQKKGLTQKEFAHMLGKQESEVSKWLSGLHNLTLQSIAKMEAVLDEEIITTPLEACNKYRKIEYITLRVYATTNESDKASDNEYNERVNFEKKVKLESNAA